MTIAWHCKPVQERLDFNYQGFVLTVHDINGLLTNSQSAINDIKQQLRREPILQRGSVGLAVVYGGAPGDADIGQAQTVAQKIYNILAMLGKEGFAFQIASYYVPLYTLGAPSDVVHIDVYLYR